MPLAVFAEGAVTVLRWMKVNGRKKVGLAVITIKGRTCFNRVIRWWDVIGKDRGKLFFPLEMLW